MSLLDSLTGQGGLSGRLQRILLSAPGVLANAGQRVLEAAPGALIAGQTGNAATGIQVNRAAHMDRQRAAMLQELQGANIDPTNPQGLGEALNIAMRYGDTEFATNLANMAMQGSLYQHRIEATQAAADAKPPKREKRPLTAEEADLVRAKGLDPAKHEMVEEWDRTSKQFVPVGVQLRSTGVTINTGQERAQTEFDANLEEAGGDVALGAAIKAGRAAPDPFSGNYVRIGGAEDHSRLRASGSAARSIGRIQELAKQIAEKYKDTSIWNEATQAGTEKLRVSDPLFAEYEKSVTSSASVLAKARFGGKASDQDRDRIESLYPSIGQLADHGRVSEYSRAAFRQLGESVLDELRSFYSGNPKEAELIDGASRIIFMPESAPSGLVPDPNGVPGIFVDPKDPTRRFQQ